MPASHPSQPAVPEWTRTAIIAVIAAALVVTLSMGVRQSFGLLMQPVGRELGITREAFAFTIAAQNLLFGLVQPFVGALTDRYGPRATLIGGTLVYAVGLAVAALATNAFGIGLGLGFFVGSSRDTCNLYALTGEKLSRSLPWRVFDLSGVSVNRPMEAPHRWDRGPIRIRASSLQIA
jgi:MFS family permease